MATTTGIPATASRRRKQAPPAREIERHSIDWVPEEERHGRLWHQAPLWLLGNFQYFTIPIGFVGPAMGLSLGWTILAGTLGIVIGTLFMAFHASQGPQLGLPQMIQSRAQFGYRGVLVSILSIGVLLGDAGGHSSGQHLGFTVTAFMAQLSIAAAYNITYAPYVSDYSRYLPRDTPTRKVLGSVFFGASGSPIWLIALGAWLAIRLGATDGLDGTKVAGNNVFHPLASVAAILVALGLIATMGMNAYGGMLSVLTGVDSVKKIRPTRQARIVTILLLTVVWFVIGQSISSSAATTVSNSLTLMLYLLVPWTATNLVDFFVVRRGHYAIADLFTPRGIYGASAWRGWWPIRRVRRRDPFHGPAKPRRVHVHRSAGQADLQCRYLLAYRLGGVRHRVLPPRPLAQPALREDGDRGFRAPARLVGGVVTGLHMLRLAGLSAMQRPWRSPGKPRVGDPWQ